MVQIMRTAIGAIAACASEYRRGLTNVVVCVCIAPMASPSFGGGTECNVRKVMEGCNEGTTSEIAEELESRLVKCGVEKFGDLVAYSRSSADVDCRAVAAFALAELAGTDQSLITRGFVELEELAEEEELEEFFPSWSRDVGPLANDGLINMLGSKKLAVRQVAIECLLEINESKIVNRKDLQAYSPTAGRRQRTGWVRLWREWWEGNRQGV